MSNMLLYNTVKIHHFGMATLKKSTCKSSQYKIFIFENIIKRNLPNFKKWHNLSIKMASMASIFCPVWSFCLQTLWMFCFQSKHMIPTQHFKVHWKNVILISIRMDQSDTLYSYIIVFLIESPLIQYLPVNSHFSGKCNDFISYMR